MERLLCGDVGFGKTEVALRAVMKCILDGKQAAILVPTTVLAQQHYLTALKRFGSFPVTIDVLSRFRTATQMKKTLQELESGKIDLIIGTHKLLQKNVHFKDLGLLIVDEEQRFGVSHKERLKEISRGVDVLTLSATPIPRERSTWRSPDFATCRPSSSRRTTGTRCRPSSSSTATGFWTRRFAGSWPAAGRCIISTTGSNRSTSARRSSRSGWEMWKSRLRTGR